MSLAEKAERVDGGEEGCVIGDVDVGGFRVEVDKDEEKHYVGVYEGADVW